MVAGDADVLVHVEGDDVLRSAKVLGGLDAVSDPSSSLHDSPTLLNLTTHTPADLDRRIDAIHIRH